MATAVYPVKGAPRIELRCPKRKGTGRLAELNSNKESVRASKEKEKERQINEAQAEAGGGRRKRKRKEELRGVRRQLGSPSNRLAATK